MAQNKGSWVWPQHSVLAKVTQEGQLEWARKFPRNMLLYNPFSVAAQDQGFFFPSSRETYDPALRIIKTDSNGYLGCGEYPITIQVDTFTVTTTPLSITILPGFPVKDTIIPFVKDTIAETILCATQPYPLVDLGPDTVLCAADSLVLEAGPANAGTNRLWSTGDTTSSLTVITSGTYWLRASYGTCAHSDTIRILFRKQLLSILGRDTTLCPTDSFLLQVPDSTLGAFHWTTPDQQQVSGHCLWASDSGQYVLHVESVTGCSALDTLQVSFHALPAAHAGPDTLLCYNQEYTMQGSGGITYQWTPARYLSSDTIPNPKAQLPHTQHYTLTVSNRHGCVDSSQVLLEVRPPLQVEVAASNMLLCSGESTTLTATPSGGDSAAYRFNWSGMSQPGSTLHLAPVESGWQQVTLTDGCSEAAIDSLWLEVVPQPVAAFSIVPSDTVVAGTRVHFMNESQNASSYHWQLGIDGKESQEVSPLFRYQQGGRFMVMLIANNTARCTDTATGVLFVESVLQVFIPSAFSPNTDPHNEVFRPISNQPFSGTLRIWNRWGELLWQGDAAIGWNGFLDGSLVPEDVYIYTLELEEQVEDREVLKGTVTVVR